MIIKHEAKTKLQLLQDNDLYRCRQVIQGPQGPLVDIDDRSFINFSSNDYLGLANNENIKRFLIDAVQECGAGAGASQLVTGHSIKHSELETKLANWLERDRALVFSSGYLANLAIASSLIDKSTIIIQDKLNHASLIDAAQLSRGRLLRYQHNNMQSLQALLQRHKDKKTIVMTDGVFSMDGDCARLEEISELCALHGALLVVDDAHGLGVMGESGGGLTEAMGLKQSSVPLLIGTFGKALGLTGAFVAGDATLIEIMLQKARTYIYTTALLPAVAAAVDKTIDLVADATALRSEVTSNIKLLKDRLDVPLASETHIQPVIIGQANAAVQVSEALYQQGILATAIRPPTVPEGTRLRLSITAAHKPSHIKQLIDVLNGVLA